MPRFYPHRLGCLGPKRQPLASVNKTNSIQLVGARFDAKHMPSAYRYSPLKPNCSTNGRNNLTARRAGSAQNQVIAQYALDIVYWSSAHWLLEPLNESLEWAGQHWSQLASPSDIDTNPEGFVERLHSEAAPSIRSHPVASSRQRPEQAFV